MNSFFNLIRQKVENRENNKTIKFDHLNEIIRKVVEAKDEIILDIDCDTLKKDDFPLWYLKTKSWIKIQVRLENLKNRADLCEKASNWLDKIEELKSHNANRMQAISRLKFIQKQLSDSSTYSHSLSELNTIFVQLEKVVQTNIRWYHKLLTSHLEKMKEDFEEDSLSPIEEIKEIALIVVKKWEQYSAFQDWFCPLDKKILLIRVRPIDLPISKTK